MANETLSVRITANASQFSSELKRLGSEFEGMTNKFEGLNKLGDGLKNVGQTMTVVGAGILAGIGGIVAKGAEWNSSVESTEFLYNNLDKKVQKAIANNSKEAKAIGLTAQQYKNGATNMATYYQNLGITATESANMSGKTMDLVADLSAVADVPFDEALGDFKSALMGNYEAVDKYGVSLSATALEESEYCKALGKTWNQLSESEKMMVAYNEIMRQSSSAQGLAKQEAQSFAMQFKLLKQQVYEAVGALGSALLPVLAPIVEKIGQAAEKMKAWIEEHPKLTQGILLVVGIIGTLLAVLGPILIVVGSCITAFASLAAASAALGIGMTALIGIPALIVAGIVALIAAGVALYQNWDTVKAKAKECWEKIKEGFKQSAEAVKQEWNALKQAASNVWNTIKTAITNVVKALATGLKNDFNNMKNTITNVWNAVKSAASTAWNAIKSTVSSVTSSIKSTITTVFNAIKSAVTSAWNGIKSSTSSIWNGIKSTISSVTSSIKSTISTAFNSIKSVVSTAWNNVKSVTSSIWNGIKSTVSSVVNGIKSTVSSAFNSVKSTVSSIWNSIKTAITSPINAAKNAVSNAMSAIKRAVNVTLKPNLKLPHISVSGKLSLNPPSVPKISVSWYKNGGIMTQPTLFGLAGGEAGPEAILPLDRIQKYFDNAFQNTMGGRGVQGETNFNLNIENFNNNTDQDVEVLVEEIARLIRRKNLAIGGR